VKHAEGPVGQAPAGLRAGAPVQHPGGEGFLDSIAWPHGQDFDPGHLYEEGRDESLQRTAPGGAAAPLIRRTLGSILTAT
jgi:hypothetical protein